VTPNRDADHAEEALRLFNEGYNCSQSVCAAFGPDMGLTRETCFAVAASFGAGMGREGEVCGAVTGALMVLGLEHWAGNAELAASKEQVYARVQDFLSGFKAVHGTLLCRELLGQDLHTPAQIQAGKDRGIHQKICAPIVAEVVRTILSARVSTQRPASEICPEGPENL
jgi:C_GCAxxG_C_C family probable redox protein